MDSKEALMIRLKNVNKVYGSKEDLVHALKGVDLHVKKGEFVAVIGSSGSGKSTLLHMIGGVDRVNSGEIFVGDQPITTMNEKQLSLYRRRHVGFVFQFYNLIPVLTVEENIELPLMLDGLKPDKQWISDILARLDLTDKRKKLPNQLSGGQQQRVAIARALIHRPKVLLADEPTGNLDSKNGREIVTLLKEAVLQMEQTLVLVTHDLSIASQADRTFVMEDGQIKLLD